MEKLLITGDFVGYYFWPREVMDMLSEWDIVAVRGNHEEMLAHALKVPTSLLSINAKYGSGLNEAINTLMPAQLDWLCNLPHPRSFECDGKSLLLCHGSPWDVSQYVYPDAETDLLERCAAENYEWVIMGHTHYPMIKRVNGSILINPGSVGQARNSCPMAHWALLDTESHELSLKTEPYDVESVVSLASHLHPELPYLVNILSGKP